MATLDSDLSPKGAALDLGVVSEGLDMLRLDSKSSSPQLCASKLAAQCIAEIRVEPSSCQ